jgi:hypothetical protein
LAIGLGRVAVIVTGLYTIRIKISRLSPNTSVTEMTENKLNGCGMIPVKAEDLCLNRYDQTSGRECHFAH